MRRGQVERRDEIALDDVRVEGDGGISILERPGRNAEEHHRTPRAVRCLEDRDPVTGPGERRRLRDADEAEIPCRQTLAQAGHGALVGQPWERVGRESEDPLRARSQVGGGHVTRTLAGGTSISHAAHATVELASPVEPGAHR